MDEGCFFSREPDVVTDVVIPDDVCFWYPSDTRIAGSRTSPPVNVIFGWIYPCSENLPPDTSVTTANVGFVVMSCRSEWRNNDI
jgi:hypothetical protein